MTTRDKARPVEITTCLEPETNAKKRRRPDSKLELLEDVELVEAEGLGLVDSGVSGLLAPAAETGSPPRLCGKQRRNT